MNDVEGLGVCSLFVEWIHVVMFAWRTTEEE